MKRERPGARFAETRRVLALWTVVATLFLAGVPGHIVGSVDAAPPDLVAAAIERPARCCEPAVRLNPPQPPRFGSVGILGDSLFVGISDRRYLGGPTLQDQLHARGSTTWTSVRVGMTMPSGLAELRYRPASVATSDVIVVGLGTNDIYNSGGMNRAGWRAGIVSVVDEARAINPAVRIVWVDVAFRRVAARATAFNAELSSLAPLHDIEICSWHDVLEANPHWLANDGIHLDGTGYRARRDIVERCIVS